MKQQKLLCLRCRRKDVKQRDIGIQTIGHITYDDISIDLSKDLQKSTLRKEVVQRFADSSTNDQLSYYDPSPPKPNKKEKALCYCGKLLSSNYALRRHQLIHEREKDQFYQDEQRNSKTEKKKQAQIESKEQSIDIQIKKPKKIVLSEQVKQRTDFWIEMD